MKKIASLALALTLSITMLAGCSDSKKDNDSADSSSITDVATLSDTITIDGEEITVDSLLSLNGVDIPFNVFRYAFLASKFDLDKGDETYWDANPGDLEKVKTQVIDFLSNYYSAEILARKYNIVLTAEDETAIQETIDANITSYGSAEAFAVALTENFLDEDAYRSVLTLDYLIYSKLVNDLYIEGAPLEITDADMTALLQSDYVRAKQILITISPLERANAVLARVNSGENFDTLIKELGEDSGMTSNPDGYCFTTGDMVEEFETATYALADNEISGIVETTYGYHIIQRLPITEEYLTANIAGILNSYNYVNSTTLTEAEMRALIIEKNYVRAKHILITKTATADTGSSTVTTSERDFTLTAGKQAQAVLDRINAGESFDELITKFDEDAKAAANPDGYCFAKDQMNIDFETAAFALTENQVSGIIENAEGFHIIKRLPIDDIFLKGNLAAVKKNYNNVRYSALLDETAANVKIVYSEYYDKLTINSFN